MPNPIEEIVERFGGQNEMSRRTGIAQSTIGRWCLVGRVPSKKIPTVIDMGKRQKPEILLNANDFFAPDDRGHP